VRADRVHAGIERLDAPPRGVDGERAREVGRAQNLGRLDQRERADRRHPLSSVDERETLLRLELKGHHAVPAHEIRRLGEPPLDANLSLADQAQRQMRERDEISARAQGATAGHYRQDLGFEHSHEVLEEREAHAAVSERERVRAQGEHEAHRARLQLGPPPRRVAPDQVELQLLHVGVPDAHRLELAESGVDPVDRAPLFQDLLDQRSRRRDARGNIRGERDPRSPRDGAEVVKGERRAPDRDPFLSGDRRGHARHGSSSPSGRGTRSPAPLENQSPTLERSSDREEVTKGADGSVAVKRRPYEARARRGSATTTAPRSAELRISLPIPWRNRRIASGSARSRKASPPSASIASDRASTRGSVGTANGSRAIRRTSSEAPGKSTPSQNDAAPRSTAPPPARNSAARGPAAPPGTCPKSGIPAARTGPPQRP